MAYMRLGDLLVSSGIITGEQLEQALALPREDGQRLGDVLIRQGVISEAQLITRCVCSWAWTSWT